MKEFIINSPKYGLKKVKVDDEDYDKLLKHTWHVYKGRMSFYAATNIKNKKGKYDLLCMHRYLKNVKSSNIHIDHKDFDGLNNKKDNLRRCTRKQNEMNKRPIGESKYLGVSLATMNRSYGTYKYWKGSIKINGKQSYLGIFPYTKEGEIEAAKRYDTVAKKNFKKFANLNFK